MSENHPHSVLGRHDYLPAAGHDLLLPAFDLISRVVGTPALHDRLIEQAELEPGHRVIEIGCGTGNLVIKAIRAQPRADVIGSDPDPRALARAERKAKGSAGLRFEHGYAQNLPHPDGGFDRVLSALMLHHLPTDIKAAALTEALRVLRPGGRLEILDIGGDTTRANTFLSRQMLRNGHVKANLALPRLLESAGFDHTLVSSEPHPRMGHIVYYQAVRPA
ncbi:class I SAM-dependent methyltransferase [Nocardia miyunensis]|uniref:class I SAM-dependent methyltransferase n=1 Tax=Nocardia miyunensis TaxID=282684 RepID=UPI000830F21C|nr:class I SAM-dependent methyltransferase [Nocardia miyunensis]